MRKAMILLAALALAVLVASPVAAQGKPTGERVATGEVQRFSEAVDVTPAPETCAGEPCPGYAIRDEESGKVFGLLGPAPQHSLGERVTVYGEIVTEGYEGGPSLVEISGLVPAEKESHAPEDRWLNFRLDVEGEPPEGATFFGGFLPGPITTQLADPDGDGVYTGRVSVDTDRFPVSEEIGVRLDGGTGSIEDPVYEDPVAPENPFPERQTTLLKDFGSQQVRGDRTFSASIGFEETAAGERLVGTAFGDLLRGGPGDDLIKGLAGKDRLEGNAGDDLILGGYGHDLIKAGPGADAVYGGPGNDRIEVAGDGPNDYVDCGPGYDTVVADRGDTLVNCENVRFR